jgi:hypothetical protein
MQQLSDHPDVRAVLDQLNIDADAEMNPPESLPADLDDQNMAEGEESWHGITDPELLQDMIADAGSMDYDEFYDEYSSMLNDPEEFWSEYHVARSKKRPLKDLTTSISPEDYAAKYPNSPGLKFINRTDLEEDAINALRRAAGLTENVLRDSTGSTLDHIADTFKRDIKDFEATGNLSKHLYQALYDYYQDDMPYGARTGDTIDPHQWIAKRITQDLGLQSTNLSPFEQFKLRNNAARAEMGMEPNPDFKEERDPHSVDGGMDNALLQDNLSGRIAGSVAGTELGPVGSAIGGAIGDTLTDDAVCNMSDRGEPCPVHGLEECWGSPMPVTNEEGFGLNPTPAAMEQEEDMGADCTCNGPARMPNCLVHGKKADPDWWNQDMDEERSPLAGQYGHPGKMTEVGKDTSWLDRLKELSGMKQS